MTIQKLKADKKEIDFYIAVENITVKKEQLVKSLQHIHISEFILKKSKIPVQKISD